MRKTFIMFSVALALLSVGCGRSDKTTDKEEYQEEAPNVVENKDDAKRADDDYKIEANKIIPVNGRPMLVDFSASWCPPCRQLHPIFEKLKEEFKGKVDFVTIDVDNYQDLSSAYGVQNIPTLIYMNPEGEELTRTVGFLDEPQLKEKIMQTFGL